MNVCGVVITSNHKTAGIYLPADDRRHYVAWSDKTMADFEDDYWTKIWTWYEQGGYGHVAAHLHSLDISNFNPKAPPHKTEAFWEIVNANRAPEDGELADAIEALGNPPALTLLDIISYAESEYALGLGPNELRDLREFGVWLRDRRNSKQIPHQWDPWDTYLSGTKQPKMVSEKGRK